MAQNAFGLTSLYDPSIATDQVALDRQMQLAQILRGQSLMPIDPNRQIGGVAYKVSPWEGVAKVMGGLLAGKMDEQNDSARAGLAQKNAAAMSGAADALLNTPPTPSDGASGSESQTDKIKRAARAALLMGNTELANKLIANYLELTPEQKNMGAKGQDPKVIGELETDIKRKEALLPLTPGQPVMDPRTGRMAFQAPENAAPEVKQLTDTITAAGVDPQSPQGKALYAQLASKQVTHQPATTVSVNTEKTYTGNIAKGIADQELGIVDAGRTAPDRVSNARNIKALLDKNPITGTAAEGRLAFNKALATAGIKSGDRVATTETLASALASSTLDAIKSSGLGSGQGFTDKDRQFLERAKSGNIEINQQTLRTLADMNEKAASAAVEKANTIIRKWNQNPDMKSMGLQEIQVPSMPQPMATPAPATGGLTSAEQAELAELRKRFGR